MSSKARLHVLTGPVNAYLPAYAEGPEVKLRFEISKGTQLRDADLIYTQNAGQCLDLLEQCEVPYVVHLGGCPFLEMRAKRLQKLLVVLSRAAGVFCVSRFIRGRFCMRGYDWPHLEAYPAGLWGQDHTPIGVQPRRFRDRKNYKLRGERPLIVTSMNLVDQPVKRMKWEGIEAMLNAVSVPARARGAMFLNSGKGKPAFTRILSEWRKLAPFEMAINHHLVDDDDRWPAVLERADVFAHPSLFDSWGRVIADAMCAGVPAMVSSRTGPVEVGKAPLKFDPLDSQETRNAFRTLMDERRRQEIGEASREEAARLTRKHRGDLAEMLDRALRRSRGQA